VGGVLGDDGIEPREREIEHPGVVERGALHVEHVELVAEGAAQGRVGRYRHQDPRGIRRRARTREHRRKPAPVLDRSHATGPISPRPTVRPCTSPDRPTPDQARLAVAGPDAHRRANRMWHAGAVTSVEHAARIQRLDHSRSAGSIGRH
jgi:hypothetical protein